VTITIIIMLALAIIVLAFVLEPILRARQDQVEIDAAVHPTRLPDFRELLLDGDEKPDEHIAEQPDLRAPLSSPEPAERRS
jgi:hypothetical protein